jgi:AraC-like DNA-binding protein
MTAEMRAIVERIYGCPYGGSLRRLYVESKALELLALRLGQLPAAEIALVSPPARRRLMERLHQARWILRERIKSPPSLQELAREVAMSTSLLKASFREAFNETAFEYVRDLRLQRARAMMLEEGASVKEAAAAVGYSSLSYFARAFARRYGTNPRAWARDARKGEAADAAAATAPA